MASLISLEPPRQPTDGLSATEIEKHCLTSAERFAAMRERMRSYRSALVAFSGGVDSTLVLKIAHEELGMDAVAMTAVSSAVPSEEIAQAQAFARGLGVTHIVVPSLELSDPRYVKNASDRCYFCKTELHRLTSEHRERLGLHVVLDGLNADEEAGHRPGRAAARERAVASPLAEARFTKDEIRAWSYRLSLPTWNKPQMACLASRLPYGTQVTAQRLNMVMRAERAMRELGFRSFRVRHHGEVARIEVAASEYQRLMDPKLRRAADEAVRSAGYTFVAVDLEPFRTGRLNEVLAKS